MLQASHTLCNMMACWPALAVQHQAAPLPSAAAPQQGSPPTDGSTEGVGIRTEEAGRGPRGTAVLIGGHLGNAEAVAGAATEDQSCLAGVQELHRLHVAWRSKGGQERGSRADQGCRWRMRADLCPQFLAAWGS